MQADTNKREKMDNEGVKHLLICAPPQFPSIVVSLFCVKKMKYSFVAPPLCVKGNTTDGKCQRVAASGYITAHCLFIGAYYYSKSIKSVMSYHR